MSKSITIAQYNKLRAGYAEAKGYDINDLTEDQNHELDNLMEADKIFRPKQALALAGDTAAVNDSLSTPTAGNSGEQANSTNGKAANKTKGGSATKRKVSAADRDNDMERVQTQLAAQGYSTGRFNAQIFAATYGKGFNEELTDFYAEALTPSTATAGDVENFLNRHGY